MVRGSLEVVEFEPRQAACEAVPEIHSGALDELFCRARREHRALTSLAAAIFVGVLHALLVIPVIWVGGLPHRQQPEQMAGSRIALQWVTLSRPSRSRESPLMSFAPALSVIHIDVKHSVLPSGASVSDRSSSPKARKAESAGLAALYGRYVGQIHARIDRAWLRPRTAIGAPLFQCQVQVDQDRRGRVGAVRLLRCNGDASWRLSLVHAIKQASPFPAPPAKAVFAPHILLSFRAMAYSPGAPSGAYQPMSAVAEYETSGVSETSFPDVFQELRRTARARHAREVIRLRIDGSKVEVEPEK